MSQMTILVIDGSDTWEIKQIRLGWTARLQGSRISMRADSFSVLLDRLCQRHSALPTGSISLSKVTGYGEQ